MVQRGVEVGIVADTCGHRELDVFLWNQTVAQRINLGTIKSFFQQLEQTMPQRLPGLGAHSKKVIQCRLRTGLRGSLCQPVKAIGQRDLREVNDLIADGDTAAKSLAAAGPAKHCKRQVLNREIAALCIGGCDPAFCKHAVGGVGVVQLLCHARAQAGAIKRSSKIATARVQPADALRILCGKQEI